MNEDIIIRCDDPFEGKEVETFSELMGLKCVKDLLKATKGYNDKGIYKIYNKTIGKDQEQKIKTKQMLSKQR